MASKKVMPGINIQHPWSQYIIEASKKIETRTYPIPKKYIGVDLALIETPGKHGRFKARIIGTVCFGESFLYDSKKRFNEDELLHLVPDNHPIFGWTGKGIKWGWRIVKVTPFKKSIEAPRPRGIVFATNCKINSSD
jgi:hypothetical protein